MTHVWQQLKVDAGGELALYFGVLPGWTRSRVCPPDSCRDAAKTLSLASLAAERRRHQEAVVGRSSKPVREVAPHESKSGTHRHSLDRRPPRGLHPRSLPRPCRGEA